MEEKEAQSKKPEDSDFQQQRLRAWQPLLTPKWVITTFFMIGVVFLPIGIAILVASRDVVEYSVRYDHLNSCDTNARAQGQNDTTWDYQRSPLCMTWVDFNIQSKMRGPVFVYYKLTNFYQNHRRYVKSRSDLQLRGDSSGSASDTTSCDPLNTFNWHNELPNALPIYPCGLIANSVFNDTFDGGLFPPNIVPPPNGTIPLNYTLGTGGWDPRDPAANISVITRNNYPRWKKAGISWQSDRDNKFRYINTTGNTGVTTRGPGGFILPRVDDEDFIVWMRTAGLPTFKKLYRVINEDIDAGSIVRIRISSVFPVSEFSGEKHVVISTTSWLGGKNDFLGIAYIVVGSVCLFLAALFLLKHCISPRPLGDMKYFNWPGQTPIRAQAAPRVAQ